jgi:RTX calcium-binding nonapeptide repeat (4 copies)
MMFPTSRQWRKPSTKASKERRQAVRRSRCRQRQALDWEVLEHRVMLSVSLVIDRNPDVREAFLNIDGDENGPANDYVYVDRSPISGVVQVNLNGRISDWNLPSDLGTEISVSGKAGNDQVHIGSDLLKSVGLDEIVISNWGNAEFRDIGTTAVTIDTGAPDSGTYMVTGVYGTTPYTQVDQTYWHLGTPLRLGSNVTSLTLNTDTYTDAVNVESTMAGTPVTIIGHGPSEVNVGNELSGVQFIGAPVNIENAQSLTRIVVLDHAVDKVYTSAHMGTIPVGETGWGYITGLGQAADIHYKYADTASITIDTSTADGDVFGVWETGVPTDLITNGLATVNVGDGLVGVQSILGPLTIESPSKATILVDDTANTGVYTTAHMGNGTEIKSGDFNYAWGYIAGMGQAADIYYKYAKTASVTIHTSTANGDVFGVSANGATTNLIGNGLATVDVENPDVGLRSIWGSTLNIENPASFMTLDVDDTVQTNQTFTLSSFVNPSDSEGNADLWGRINSNINYEYSDTLELNLNIGSGDLVNVQGTGPGPTNIVSTTTTFQAANTFVVGNAGSVQGILGPLNIEDPKYYNNITVDGSADPFRTVTLSTFVNPADSDANADSWGKISGLAPGDINYDYGHTSGLTVHTGDGDSVYVQDTGNLGNGSTTNLVNAGTETMYIQATTGPLTVLDPSGTASIDISPQAEDLDNIAGALTVNGNRADALIINDQRNTHLLGTEYSLASNILTRDTTEVFGVDHDPAITFTGLGSLELDTGSDPNQVHVESTSAPTTVKAGAGTVLIDVSGQAENLDNLPGTLTVNGNGFDALIINDQKNPNFLVPTQFSVTSSTLTRTVLPTDEIGVVSHIAWINFHNVASVGINGGATHNVFNVESAAAAMPISINTGSDNDVVNAGNPDDGLIQAIEFLAVHGNTGTTLVLNDQANAPVLLKGARRFGDYTRETSPNYQITDHDVTRTDRVIERDPDSSTGPDLESYTIVSDTLYHSLVSYSQIAALVINGGSSHNTFNMQSASAGTSVALSGQTGGDEFTGSFSGDFNPTLTLTGMSSAVLDVTGNFAGSFLAPRVGTLAAPMEHITIHGSVLDGSRIKVNYLDTLTVDQNLYGTVDGYGTVADPNTQFTIGDVTVGGTLWGNNGSITAPSIKSINMIDQLSLFGGNATETMPGADFQAVNLAGSVSSTGTISAGMILTMTVGSDMAGHVAVAGDLGTLTVGGNLSGSVSAASLGTLIVGGTITGNVSAPTIASALVSGTTGNDVFGITATGVTLNGLTVLSGASSALTVNGLAGDDLFMVTDNAAAATLNGDEGDDTVVVLATTGLLTVNTQSGANTVDVGDIGFGLDGIQAALTVDGQGGSVVLNVNDQASFRIPNYTVTSDAVTRTGTAEIDYRFVTSLVLGTGFGGNTTDVQSTDFNTPVTVNTGLGRNTVDPSLGTNTVNVGSSLTSSSTLDLIQGRVTVNGLGSTALCLNDQGNSADSNYFVTASTFSRTGTAPVTYGGTNTLTVNAGPGEVQPGIVFDVISVYSTAADTSTIINGGNGDNEFVFAGYDGTLNNISGQATLHSGGYLYDAVVFDDGVDTVGQSYTLTANTMTRSGIFPVTWDTMNQVILYTGAGHDQINVQAVAAGSFESVVAGTGDTITVGSLAPGLGGILDNIRGSLNAQSYGGQAASVIIDDSGDARSHPLASLQTGTYGYDLTGLAPATINFPLDPASSVKILGGIGNDTFTVANVLPASGITIDGGGGTNKLIGPNTSTAWRISGRDRGALGRVSFVSFANLVGGPGVDRFQFAPSGQLSGTIDGGRGGDWLDYSQFRAAVTVNLTTGAATAVRGGVANIQNVRGGPRGNTLTGNALGNILVGGAGADVLKGGSGRSVLIGGRGNDTVTGGSVDDILIGGTTDFDARDDALQSILMEWQRTDRTYVQRIADLTNGGGLNRGNKLIFGKTVHDDGGSNVLTGGSGLDWFLKGKSDRITDRQTGEVVN